MRDELNKILSHVNDWLKFAEAKNAGLLALNMAAVAGIMQGFSTSDNTDNIFKWIMVSLFTISICIVLFSFLPVLRQVFIYKKYDDQQFDAEKDKLNCYYFGDHAKINCSHLIKLLSSKHAPQYVTNSLDVDIASQIITNAEIAIRKYKLFTVSAWISFGGFVMGLILILTKIF